MNKLIFLIIFWAAVTNTLAEKPSWYPDNDVEIIQNCVAKHNYTPDTQETTSPEFFAYFLCSAKGLNVYSEESGLNVERLTYTLFESSNKVDCKIPLAQYCADKYKDMTSKGEMIFEVSKCLTDDKNNDKDKC